MPRPLVQGLQMRGGATQPRSRHSAADTSDFLDTEDGAHDLDAPTVSLFAAQLTPSIPAPAVPVPRTELAGHDPRGPLARMLPAWDLLPPAEFVDRSRR